MVLTNFQDHDKPVLSRLVDISIAPPSSAAPPPTTSSSLGFSLEFHFAENEFFSNRTLTKEYDVRCEPDAAEPFAFDGPEIVACRGCKILWKKGKNATLRQGEKKCYLI